MPREAWILAVATLINRAGTMALPFLVLYLTESCRFSTGAAAATVALYGAGALVTSPLAGWLCDRIGAVRVMKASLVLSSAALLAYPLARSVASVCAITIIWAVPSEAFRPASFVVTADLVRPEQRKAAFALMRLMINLGMSVGPAAGGLLASVSYPALFVIDGGTSILSGLVLVALWPRPAAGKQIERAPDERAASAGSDFGALADRRFLLFLAALIPVQIVFFQFESTMPLFLVRELGFSASTFGMLLTINAVVIIFLEVSLNAAMERGSEGTMLALGALLIGAGFGGLAFVTGPWGVFGTVVVWTFGEMILLPGASAYAANSTRPERRGQSIGLLQMTFALSFAIAPRLGAGALEAFGPRLFWVAACGAAVVSAAAT